MKIRNGMEAEYAEYTALNSKDPYSARCVSYGEDWANLMEAAIGDSPDPAGVIVDVAQATSREADTDGITGFMYGAAVAGLARFWEHGEALRHWHNKDIQIGTEGDKANESGGVLNPAIVIIG